MKIIPKIDYEESVLKVEWEKGLLVHKNFVRTALNSTEFAWHRTEVEFFEWIRLFGGSFRCFFDAISVIVC